MSRKQYRARSKKVQKLGRDGLVEQDKATGQEEQISQRAADVSFGPKRSQKQVAGRASPQRTPVQGKRRKQPRPSPSPEPILSTDGDVPDAPEVVPTMRQADDVPATVPPPRADGTSSRKRRQQKRANRLNPDAPAHPFVEDSADGGRLHFEAGHDPPSDTASPESLPEETELAAPRGADDVPMRERPPGRRTPPPAQHRVEGNGRLQFEPERTPPPADPDTRTRRAAEADPSAESPPHGGTPGLEPASEPTTGPTRRQHKQHEKAERRVEQSGRRLEKAQAKLPTRRRAHLEKEYDANTGKVRHCLRFEAEVEPEAVKPSLPAQVGRTVKTAAVMKLHGKIRETERQNVVVEAAHKGEFTAERGVGRFLRWNKQRLRSKPYRAVRQAERRLRTDQTRLAWQTALRDNPELRRKNVLAKWVQKQKIKRKYMDNTKKFDRRLRNLLTLSTVSRAELAHHLGVTLPVLNRWLNGTSAPDVYQFRAVARFFGIPYKWFLDDNFPSAAELAARLGLSEDTVDGLLALAEDGNEDVLDTLDDAIYAMVSAVNAAREGSE